MIVLDTITAVGTGPVLPSPRFFLSPVAGDLLTVRKFNPHSEHCRLLRVDYISVSNALVRLDGLSFHDGVQGTELFGIAPGNGVSIFPTFAHQELLSEDHLNINFPTPGAVSYVVVLTLWYSNLPGEGSTEFLSYSDYIRKARKHHTVTYAPAGVGMTGYTAPAQVADTLFKADKQYALIGARGDAPSSFIRLTSRHTANYHIGFPSQNADDLSGQHFLNLSLANGDLDCIPVFDGGQDILALTATAIGVGGFTSQLLFTELA